MFTRLVSSLIAAMLLLTTFSVAEATVTGGTVLPSTNVGQSGCEDVMSAVNIDPDGAREAIANRSQFSGAMGREILVLPNGINSIPVFTDSVSGNDILACGIKTGNIRMWMIPFYLRFVLEFVIGLAGLVAVGGIVFGGYLYLFAGLSDEKERGKKSILYGIVGFVMTLVAWAVVNVVVALFS